MWKRQLSHNLLPLSLARSFSSFLLFLWDIFFTWCLNFEHLSRYRDRHDVTLEPSGGEIFIELKFLQFNMKLKKSPKFSNKQKRYQGHSNQKVIENRSPQKWVYWFKIQFWNFQKSKTKLKKGPLNWRKKLQQL